MEPKHYVYRPNIWLVLAITLEILALLYRNLVKSWEIACGSPSKNKTYYIVDRISKTYHQPKVSY
jgi:hypothetical protein